MSNSAILRLLKPRASTDGTNSDAALLTRFHATRDEQAFAAIVQRYDRLVWSVCRQMLQHEADAEDAFQATFLALIRSSRSIRGPLAPWLHRVAYRVSIKLRQRLSRQTLHERSHARSEADQPVPDGAWENMLTAVHDEIATLPEKLRVPLVLCCLEGLGVTEAAKATGIKLGTFSARLTQAKQQLLTRLTRRGLPITAAGLSIITISQATAAIPHHLPLALQLLKPGTISPLIQSLCQGVVVMYSRMQWAAAASVLLGVAGVTGWAWVGAQQPGGPPRGGLSSGQSGGPAGGLSSMGGPGAMGMNPLSNMPQPVQYEYRFVPTGSRTEQEYRGYFQLMEQQGFEFCGTVPLSTSITALGIGAGTGPSDTGSGAPAGGAPGGAPAGGGASEGGGALLGGGTGSPDGSGIVSSTAKAATAMVFKRPIHGRQVNQGAGMAPNQLGSMMGGMPSGMGAGGMDATGGGGLTEAQGHEQLIGHWDAIKSSSPTRSIQFGKDNHATIDGKACRYYINPRKANKELNLVGDGTLFQCIYEVKNGVLKIAYYGRPETDRPTGFTATNLPGSSPLIVTEFRKVQPGIGGDAGIKP